MLFQNKRKTLSKRLWRARLPATNNHQQQLQLSDHRSAMDVGSCPSIGTDGGGRNVFRDCCVTNRPAYAPPTPSSRNIAPEDYVRYQMFLELIRNLKDKQLETLSTAISVECCGNDDLTSVKSDCVLIPKNLCRTAEAHFIACQVWRWPDLRSHKELKRIPSCSSRQDPVYICCNPAHWSRVCETGELSIYLYLYRHIIISNSKKKTHKVFRTPLKRLFLIRFQEIFFYRTLRPLVHFYCILKDTKIEILTSNAILFIAW